MSYIIDRRLNGKNKSMVNRQRFLERYRIIGHVVDTEVVGKIEFTGSA